MKCRPSHRRRSYGGTCRRPFDIASTLSKHLLIHQFADYVIGKLANLLRSTSRWCVHRQACIRQLLQRAVRPARKSDHRSRLLLRSFRRRYNILRTPAHRKSPQNIALLDQRLHLPRKNILEPEVISDTTQHRRISRQRNRRQCPPMLPESPHKFTRDMLSIRSRPAIPAQINAPSLSKTPCYHLRNGDYRINMPALELTH